MYVVSTEGTMNTVSRLGDRWRFISAIWNSYSKSLTARSPRMISDAPTFLREIHEQAPRTGGPRRTLIGRGERG